MHTTGPDTNPVANARRIRCARSFADLFARQLETKDIDVISGTLANVGRCGPDTVAVVRQPDGGSVLTRTAQRDWLDAFLKRNARQEGLFGVVPHGDPDGMWRHLVAIRFDTSPGPVTLISGRAMGLPVDELVVTTHPDLT